MDILRQRIEQMVHTCRNNHLGFQRGRYVGFCPECAEQIAALALPDGPEPLSAVDWRNLQHLAEVAEAGAIDAGDIVSRADFMALAAKCRAHAEAQTEKP